MKIIKCFCDCISLACDIEFRANRNICIRLTLNNHCQFIVHICFSNSLALTSVAGQSTKFHSPYDETPQIEDAVFLC